MEKRLYMIFLIVCSIFLIGCTEKKEGAEVNVYYINTDINGISEEPFIMEAEKPSECVAELLDAMNHPDDEKMFQSAIPADVQVKEFKIKNNQLEMIFDEGYLLLNKSSEVLLRAAVVKTMVQISGIDYVSFYVGKEPVLDSSGKAIGVMCAEDFVQNTGYSLKNYQSTELKLYFSSNDGTKLVAEKREDVHYNINTSIEKLAVEQLMKGTTSDKRNATIPTNVKLLGVAVKDGICYVNFDSAFLTNTLNQKPEVTIYSIVNSIIANGNASKVQILIDGSSDVTFMGSIDLGSPLEWKADLIEE